MALLPNRSPLDLAARDSFRARRQRRLAARIGWRYSLLFVAALLAIGVVRLTGIGPEGGSTRILSFRVTDGATGMPLAGASVSLGGVATTADEAGIARFETGWQTQQVLVSVPGYSQAASEITDDSPADHSVALLVDGSTPAPTTDSSSSIAPTSAATPSLAGSFVWPTAPRATASSPPSDSTIERPDASLSVADAA